MLRVAATRVAAMRGAREAIGREVVVVDGFGPGCVPSNGVAAVDVAFA